MLPRENFKKAILSTEKANYLSSLPYRSKIASIEYSFDPETGPVDLDVLRLFAKDTDERVRSYLAAHSETPLEILNILVSDEDIGVLSSLIHNPNTPKEIIDKIVSYDNYDLNRQLVVYSLHVDNNQLLKIIESDNLYIDEDGYEFLMERRVDLPLPILEKIYSKFGYSEYILKGLALQLNTPKYMLLEIIEKHPYIGAFFVSTREELDEDISLRLLNNDQSDIFTLGSNLATNENTQASVLELLAHKSPRSSHYIAKHRNTNEKTFEYLLESTPNLETTRNIVNNYNAPRHIREEAQILLSKLEEKELGRFKKRIDTKIRSIPNYPTKLLDSSLKDINSKPSLELELLLRLKSHLKKS